MNNILKYLEDEKLKIIIDVEETKSENKFLEKKKKKVSTIEVEENIEEEYISENSKEKGDSETFIEVKDKIFTKASHDIIEQILYEKRVFVKERRYNR